MAPTGAAFVDLVHQLVSPQKLFGFITAYHMYIYIYIYILYIYIPYIKLILSVVPSHTRKKSNQWILIHNIMNFGSNWFQITHFAKRAFFWINFSDDTLVYLFCPFMLQIMPKSFKQIIRTDPEKFHKV